MKQLVIHTTVNEMFLFHYNHSQVGQLVKKPVYGNLQFCIPQMKNYINGMRQQSLG